MKPIITSLLDLDKYKLTMGYVFFVKFSNVSVKYKFKNRSNVNLLPYKDEIIEQLKSLCMLRFTPEELKFIKERNPFFSSAYIEFLRNLKLNFDYLDIREVNGDLYIGTYSDVPLIYSTWFETFILAIIQEIHTNTIFPNMDYSEGKKILQTKIDKAKKYFNTVSHFTLSDFGGRRRFNKYWHEFVIDQLHKQLPRECFTGTSNMYFAKKYDILDIGTMAHEYLMISQGLEHIPLRNSVKYMLQTWSEIYRGNLGIALTDIVGFDAFLKDFDLYFSNLFTGCRNDSGDPFWWGDKLIEHYINLGISPITKTAVYSNSVDFDLMFKIIDKYSSIIKLSFGIGTFLVNDFGNLYKAMQMVMKLVEVNGNPVAKIPDDPGKGMCESPDFVNEIKKTFNIK